MTDYRMIRQLQPLYWKEQQHSQSSILHNNDCIQMQNFRVFEGCPIQISHDSSVLCEYGENYVHFEEVGLLYGRATPITNAQEFSSNFSSEYPTEWRTKCRMFAGYNEANQKNEYPMKEELPENCDKNSFCDSDELLSLHFCLRLLQLSKFMKIDPIFYFQKR